MSGPNRPPLLQGLPPLAYGGPNQYLGQQRQPSTYSQQPAQRPPAQSQAPTGPWLGGVMPGFFTGNVHRPQQQPDGRLSDLLTAAQRPRPTQYVSQALVQQHAAMHGNPSNSPAMQPQQVVRVSTSANVPQRSSTPNGQQNYPAMGYRPPPLSSGNGYSQSMQAAFQYQASRVPTNLQARPNPVQSPSPNIMQRPGGGQLTGAAAATIAQQYNAIVSGMRPNLYAPVAAAPQIQAPQLSEEDRKVLPRKSLKRKAVAAAGDADAEMELALEAALVQLADEFLSGAVAFGCGLARRRKCSKLDPADVAVYLEQTWQIHVPGFSDRQIKPYKRPAAKALHDSRTAAIRQATTSASEAAATAAEKEKAEAEARKAAENVNLLPD